jgi:uncharacterized membrane protein YdfJ with MMPL/SSD domain
MRRLTHLGQRRHVVILGVWLALAAGAIPLAQQQDDRLTSGGFEVPGSQSARVAATMAQHFPQTTIEGVALLVECPQAGTAADYRLAFREVQVATYKALGLSLSSITSNPASRSSGMSLSPLGIERLEALEHGLLRAVIPIEVHTGVRETIDDVVKIFKKLEPERAQSGPVKMRFIGRAVQVAVVHELSERDAKRSEAIAVPLVLLALLAVFGSLTAALLPIALGLSSVVLTGAAIYLLSRQLILSVFVVNVASMLGVGVAIDYSLFMLVRYREEAARGRDLATARRIMLKTSGRTVLVAGGTVGLSLISLFLIKNTILRSMAGGAIIVVAVSMAVATVVLPALIVLLGDRLTRRPRLLSRARLRQHTSEQAGLRRRAFWERWVATVMRRPVLSAAASGAVLLGLTVPVLQITLGTDTLRQLPRNSETRQAAEAAARLQGPDAESPVVITAEYGSAKQALAGRKAIASARNLVSRGREIANVGPVMLSQDRRAYAIFATLRSDPESSAALAAVTRLRRSLPARVGPLHGAALEVGGTTATIIDAANEISGSMWKVVLAVVCLSYLSLLLVLRSAILPLKAVVMNLLSVGAAMGVLVAVFQLGWLNAPLGVESFGHIEIYVPPLVFAVVYGLSMDYELFLLTRIQERYQATGDNRRAVAEGVSSSARTISCAALIMVLVFMAFIFTSMPIVQEIGVGSAVAIALDATLTRLVLLPATMTLLGERNWWAPRVLRTVLAPRARRHAPTLSTKRSSLFDA